MTHRQHAALQKQAVSNTSVCPSETWTDLSNTGVKVKGRDLDVVTGLDL